MDITTNIILSALALIVPLVLALLGMVSSFYYKITRLEVQNENHQREIDKLRDMVAQWLNK